MHSHDDCAGHNSASQEAGKRHASRTLQAVCQRWGYTRINAKSSPPDWRETQINKNFDCGKNFASWVQIQNVAVDVIQDEYLGYALFNNREWRRNSSVRRRFLCSGWVTNLESTVLVLRRIRKRNSAGNGNQPEIEKARSRIVFDFSQFRSRIFDWIARATNWDLRGHSSRPSSPST